MSSLSLAGQYHAVTGGYSVKKIQNSDLYMHEPDLNIKTLKLSLSEDTVVLKVHIRSEIKAKEINFGTKEFRILMTLIKKEERWYVNKVDNESFLK